MNIDKSLFRWDSYSDQPVTLDRRVKRALRWRCIGGVLKKMFAIVFLPRPLLRTVFERKSISSLPG